MNRFCSKVDETETGWLWTASLKKGYGQFAVRHGFIAGYTMSS